MAHTETKCRRNDDDDDAAGEDDQYYEEDGWDEDEAGGVGLRCRQNKAPKMEAIQGNEKGRKLHAVASLFEPLLVAFSSKVHEPRIEIATISQERAQNEESFHNRKSLSCALLCPEKKSVPKQREHRLSLFLFITLHYIPLRYMALHSALHFA